MKDESKTSKEEKVIELFFNEGTKHWHFKEVVKEAKISEDRANHWLKKLVKEEIILHIKEKGKMPYFIANFDKSNYKMKKKMYVYQKLIDSGLIEDIQSLNDVKTAVIYGSFSRADWYTESDIDIFIFGKDDKIDIDRYFSFFGREIQLHSFKNKKELKEIRSGIMQNIINGYFIKGKIQDLVEVKV
jgi:predicted nucleotidyltransferase